MALDTLKPRPGDILQQMSPAMYERAYRGGMSLSAFLEREDPSSQYEGDAEMRGLDAYGRLLHEAGIKTASIPEAGFWADKFEAFDQDEHTRALAPEWMYRQWRRAASGRSPDTRKLFSGDDGHGMPTTRALYGTDFPAGSVITPYVDAASARYLQLAPIIPLAEVVALTTPIDGDAYRAYYLTNDSAQQRMVRVAEGAEVPRAKLVGGDHTIRLHKFGRALEVTYEILRRQRIDVVALHIARMAIQAEMDKVGAVIDVMVNGDGNTGTSGSSYNLSTMDPAAPANTLTLKGWLNYRLQWPPPYTITTILANANVILQTQMLNMGSANIPMTVVAAASSFGLFQPINPQLSDQVRYGVHPSVPANTVLGFDSRFGIERVYEVGGSITEIERYVSRQTQEIIVTEVEGYAVFDQNAAKLLNVNA